MSRGLRAVAGVTAAAGVLALTVGAGGCATDGRREEQLTEGGERALTVFAASSLGTAFQQLAAAFEATHPGVTVRINAAGSSDLVAQAAAGAPADVLATADTTTMARASGLGLTRTEPHAFATNTMTIVTPPGNPAAVTSLADLAQSSRVTTVLCAPQVPCGAAAVRVEQASGVSITPVSEEPSAAAVLGKVTAAEADAGIVYVTDARQAGPRVAEVPIPPEVNATNTYPIVILKESPQPALAEEFIALVQGPQGQDVLRRAGFGPA